MHCWSTTHSTSTARQVAPLRLHGPSCINKWWEYSTWGVHYKSMFVVAECLCKEALQSLLYLVQLYSVQEHFLLIPMYIVHLLQQVGLFHRSFLLITLPCSTTTYHTLALPQMWAWVAFKRIFDCLRKKGCEAHNNGTKKSCADPFLWRWCKTLPLRT